MAEIITKDCKEYHIWDKVNGVWNRLFFKTNAKSVEADDGKELQTKVGALNGITSDLSCEDESIAISAKAVNDSLTQLDTNFVENIYVGEDGNLHKLQGGADTVLNFNNLELICNFRPSYASTTYTLENGILKSSTEDNFGTTNILRTYDNDGHDVITIKKKCKIMYCGFYYPPTIKEVEAGFSNKFYRPDTNYLGYFLAIIG